MTDPMTALVRRAAQRSDDQIAALTGSAAETDLMTRILAEPAPLPAGGRVRRPRRRARRIGTLAGLAAAASVAVTAFVAVQSDDGDRVAWAAEAIALADDTPRLLIEADGWQVEDTQQVTEERGSMTFTNGDRELYLDWTTTVDLAEVVANREENGWVGEPAIVMGREAVSFEWPDGQRNTYWQQGDAVVELMTWRSPMDDDEYAALLDALSQVDAETWLSALPGTVVRPDDAAAVIGEMLAGVALPDGVAVAPPAGAMTRDQLAGIVEADARCAWIEEWIRATGAGDAAAVTTAATALSGARDWPVQDEARPLEASIWAAVDQLVEDGVLVGGHETVIEGDTPFEGWRVQYQCLGRG
ncbi:hypothetical protein [Jiangella mangrovi]|uniref:Uncharacterized protein n=1 Tax=Jiangella mangrovi TaxID=1524084 RepID=A0A7W9LM98_9ACTN|nr:hypothetical protein [Jiangella mangrovi]MBB5788984.1 hypothetical protein [Jiangella mangrovi]